MSSTTHVGSEPAARHRNSSAEAKPLAWMPTQRRMRAIEVRTDWSSSMIATHFGSLIAAYLRADSPGGSLKAAAYGPNPLSDNADHRGPSPIVRPAVRCDALRADSPTPLTAIGNPSDTCASV